jgi:hypothetical protein
MSPRGGLKKKWMSAQAEFPVYCTVCRQSPFLQNGIYSKWWCHLVGLEGLRWTKVRVMVDHQIWILPMSSNWEVIQIWATELLEGSTHTSHVDSDCDICWSKFVTLKPGHFLNDPRRAFMNKSLEGSSFQMPPTISLTTVCNQVHHLDVLKSEGVLPKDRLIPTFTWCGFGIIYGLCNEIWYTEMIHKFSEDNDIYIII